MVCDKCFLTHSVVKDLHNLWRRRVISFKELKGPQFLDLPLDEKQQLVISLLEAMISKRHEHYKSVDCSLDYFDSDSESEVDENIAKTSLSHAMNKNLTTIKLQLEYIK